MYLYHISYCKDELNKVFVPRVPDIDPRCGENLTIPRICLANSVAHCIQAIQFTPINDSIITLYKVDTKYLDKRYLVTPEQLTSKCLVIDALENREYWYTKPLKLTGKYFQVKGMNLEFELAWKTIKREDIIPLVKKHLIKNTLHLDQQEIKKILSHKTSYGVYQSFMRELNKRQLWDQEDEFYDSVAELQWAQIKKISNVQLLAIN